MKKIIFFLCLLFLFPNISFAKSQSTVSLYERQVERNQEEIDELSEYEMRYGIVKDIKYFEKLLEKYEYILEREKAKVKALEAILDCKKGSITCVFKNYNSDNLSLEEIYILISKADDDEKDAEINLEDLQETVNYLHKSQKEIEEREKTKGNKNKFESEKSEYVNTDENFETETNLGNTKEEQVSFSEEKDIKNILKEKLENLVKNYSQKQKKQIFNIILEKLNNYQKNETINILIDILKENI